MPTHSANVPPRFAICALMLCGAAASAQESDPLFASFETLEVALEAPFRQLMRDRDEKLEVPGKLRYTAPDNTTVELDVKVRTRGKFRARKNVCDFTPLRLNLRTSAVADTIFAQQDKLKLVTHCEANSDRYEQAVITEYLTYRILNVMTDFSYRARLLKIRYVYTDSSRKIETYAFLIENDKRLARRLGHDLMAVRGLKVKDLVPEYTNLVSVFQFLIGNTDFSPIAAAEGEDCCHNHTPFSTDGEVFYSIPYDFDQCGLVDVPHAAPNSRFRLRSVRQRLYRGRCVNNAQLPETLERFRNARADLEALIGSQAELTRATRAKAENYMGAFYRLIDKPKSVQKLLVKKCN